MKSIKIPAPDFNLAMTLDSGQVFHWEKVGNGFVGLIGDAPVYVQQRGNVLKVNMEGGAPATPGERRVKGVGSRSLPLQLRNRQRIISLLIIHSQKSLRHFPTIRLLTQRDNFFEALVSFASRN